MSSDNLEAIQTQYQAGKTAFERGQYRQSVQYLEEARDLVNPNSRLGGEVQIWLVTAYEAAGNRSEARSLCRQLTGHPDYYTRKEGKRILYILEAPELKTRPEWLTQIPDLTAISDRDRQDRTGGSQYASTAAPKRQKTPNPVLLDPVDPTQVNTKDNQFVWVALGAVGLAVVSLLWMSWG